MHVQEFERELPRCAPTLALARAVVEQIRTWSPGLSSGPLELKLRGEAKIAVCHSVAELEALPELGTLYELELSISLQDKAEHFSLRIEVSPDRPSLLTATSSSAGDSPSVRTLFTSLQNILLAQESLQLSQRSTQRRRIPMPMLRIDNAKLVNLEVTLVEIIARWLEAVPAHAAAGITVDLDDGTGRDSSLKTVAALPWPPSIDTVIKLRVDQSGTSSRVGGIVHVPFVPYPTDKETKEIEIITIGLRSNDFNEEIEKAVKSWLDNNDPHWDIYTLWGAGRFLAGCAVFGCFFRLSDSSIFRIGTDEVIYGALFLAAAIYFVAIRKLCPRVWYSEAKRDARREWWWSVFKNIQALLLITIAGSLILSKLDRGVAGAIQPEAQKGPSQP